MLKSLCTLGNEYSVLNPFDEEGELLFDLVFSSVLITKELLPRLGERDIVLYLLEDFNSSIFLIDKFNLTRLGVSFFFDYINKILPLE
jgi:hypothetical protein